MQQAFAKIDHDKNSFTLVNLGSIVSVDVYHDTNVDCFVFRVTTVAPDHSITFDAKTVIEGLSKLGMSLNGLSLAR